MRSSFFSRALAETKDLRAFLGRLRGLACHMAKGLPAGQRAACAAIGSGHDSRVDESRAIFADFRASSESRGRR